VNDLADTPFEPEIRAYEEADRSRRPPEAPVLFYGSSSLRFWPELEHAFPGHPVLNRGFGGATIQDCIQLFPRLVKPYAPRVIIFYAGDNDLAHGCRPIEVIGRLKRFVELIHTQLPSSLLGVISIKPSPSYGNDLLKIRETNTLIRELAFSLSRVAFIDILGQMLGPDATCRRELFHDDGVHMTSAGYEIWKHAVMAYLTGDGAGFRRERHGWFSPHVKREMDLLLIGQGGRRVLVFPTVHGNPYQYEELGMVEALRARLERDELQLFCLDSLDSDTWYNQNLPPRERVLRHIDFENYVLREVLPFSHRENANPAVVAHGCSLGAFHAVNIALRHPGQFTHAVGISGRYDLTRSVGGFPDLLDGYCDDEVYFNTPCHFMANITDPQLLEQMRRLDITIVIGESDTFMENNRAFSQTLWNKGIWHAFCVWDGYAHSPRRWCEMVRRYL
jgi:esterase/lipase superfamily enzyme/lysophospholipase L1-like esterase